MTERNLCTGCSACYLICPEKCIGMVGDDEGFLYPHIDAKRCISCGACDSVCPVGIENKEELCNVYAAKNMNDERIKSSSGGVFTSLAKWIISNDGVVFGAAFTEDCKRVVHIPVYDMDYLEKLRGSKYLQSEVGDTYKEAKRYLDDERYVLYTGTPCQIAGLMMYLGKKYDKLYTVDVICHGVPSQKTWNRFLEDEIGTREIVRVSFRDKRYGWKKSVMTIDMGGAETVLDANNNPYITGFLANLYLRKSCYNCRFKDGDYYSDITLGDFWGIERILPDFYDEKGVSVVCLHTKQGKKLFESVTDDIEVIEVDKTTALKSNPSYYKNGYSEALAEYAKKDMNKRFGVFVNKYCGTGFRAKLLRLMIRLKNRL